MPHRNRSEILNTIIDLLSFEQLKKLFLAPGKEYNLTPLHILMALSPESKIEILKKLASKSKPKEAEAGAAAGDSSESTIPDRNTIRQLLCSVKTSYQLTPLDYLILYCPKEIALVKEYFLEEEWRKILFEQRCAGNLSLVNFLALHKPISLPDLKDAFEESLGSEIIDSVNQTLLVKSLAKINHSLYPKAMIQILSLFPAIQICSLITFNYSDSSTPRYLFMDAIETKRENIFTKFTAIIDDYLKTTKDSRSEGSSPEEEQLKEALAVGFCLPLLMRFNYYRPLKLTELQLRLCKQFQTQIKRKFLELTNGEQDCYYRAPEYRPELLTQQPDLQIITGLTPKTVNRSALARGAAATIARLGAFATAVDRAAGAVVSAASGPTLPVAGEDITDEMLGGGGSPA